VAQSPESPAGGTPPKSEVAAFVIGLVLGLGIGGTILTLVAFALVVWLTQLLFPKSSNDVAWLPYLADIPALALGWWAIVQSRKAMNFFSGALIGLAAGMLGGVTICALMLGGLGDMH
jgi:hypothetical protein